MLGAVHTIITRLQGIHKIITVIFSLNILLGVKVVHLIIATDLFKISNSIIGGKALVTCSYSSLQRQRQIEREPAAACRGLHELKQQSYLSEPIGRKHLKF